MKTGRRGFFGMLAALPAVLACRPRRLSVEVTNDTPVAIEGSKMILMVKRPDGTWAIGRYLPR